MVLVLLTFLKCYMSAFRLVHYALFLTPACSKGFFPQRKDVCVGVSLYLCRSVGYFSRQPMHGLQETRPKNCKKFQPRTPPQLLLEGPSSSLSWAFSKVSVIFRHYKAYRIVRRGHIHNQALGRPSTKSYLSSRRRML